MKKSQPKAQRNSTTSKTQPQSHPKSPAAKPQPQPKSRPTQHLLLFISFLLLAQAPPSLSKKYAKSWELLPNLAATDISSNGDSTWACSPSGQIVRLNPEVSKRVLALEVAVDAALVCSRIEAAFDNSVLVVTTAKALYLLEPSAPDFFVARKVDDDVLDVGCSAQGPCFYLKDKLLFELRAGVGRQAAALEFKGVRLDVGWAAGGVLLFVVTEDKQLVKLSLQGAAVEARFLDIYATDAAVGNDGRLYVATTLFGTFVFNEKAEMGFGHDFDQIAELGESVAAGYELFLVSKNKRVLRSVLVERDY